MSDSIEVHVLGGKIGESIVLRLPGDVWGVVDNYTANLKRPEHNPTIKFLRKNNVKHLSFLCLTHPHHDHYKGMSHILKEFRPDRVWLFGSATHLCVRAMVLKASANSKYANKDDLENFGELVEIFDLIEAEYKDATRTPRLKIERLQLGMSLLKINSTPHVSVVAIGASGGRTVQYERTLEDLFDTERGFLADRLPRVNHNMISSGLLIEYGLARIVLGGDMDQAAWEETMELFPAPNLNCRLVKVSHHGSTTGYCDGLWKELSPGNTAVAVLTPYSSQGLPSGDGLAHISANAKVTLTTSLAATALATDWHTNAADTSFQGMSADALVTLRSLFPKASASSDRLEGICSFSVSPQGDILHTFSGEAGRLSGS